MSETWMFIFLAAVIGLGLVGAHVLQMVLKELVPLLRTMAQERQAIAAKTDLAKLPELVGSLEQRLVRVEANQRKLRDESQFLQKLLNDRPDEPASTRRARDHSAFPPTPST